MNRHADPYAIEPGPEPEPAEMIGDAGGIGAAPADGEAPRYTRDAFAQAVEHPKVRAVVAKLPDDPGLRWETLFPRTAGLGAPSDAKRRAFMLGGVLPRLHVLLYPGERIEFITKGFLHSFVEAYFMGIWALIINRTLFLFTNYRVILIQSDGKGRAKTMMWQIPYDRMRKYGAGSLGFSIGFRLAGGKVFKFAGVPPRDRKMLKDLVRSRLDGVRASGFAFPAHADRDPLCARCATAVPAKIRACAECGDEFINPLVPAGLSLIVPGLGELYLGHYGLAIFEIIGFLFLLLVAAVLVLSGEPQHMVMGALLLVGGNTVDAAITHHVARKGAMPRRLAWRG